MTGRYQAYSEYKDSGINWLGSIPAHWEVRPLKYQSSCNDEVINEKTAPDHEVEYVDIGSVSAVDGISKTEKMLFGNAPSRARRKVQDGDIIVSTVRTYLEAIAPITNPPENMLVSTGFAVIRPNSNFDKGFASYCLRSRGFIEEVVTRSVGVSYPAINSTDLINITTPLIPRKEQQKIASFLDNETAKIDTLICKQEKLIELLKEKRQAVISHAVTRGINPDATMKASGVEWLGEVPEHWIVGRFKRVVDIAGRIGYRGYTVDDIVDEGKGAIVLSPSNINERGFTLEKNAYLSWDKYYESPEIMAEKGDILLAKTSWSFGKVADIPVVDSPMTINPQMVLLKNTKIDPFYLWCLLKTDALQSYIFNSNTGSYMPTMTQESIGNLPVLIPPQNEVVQIVEHLRKQILNINALIDKSVELLEILDERSTSLISAAVSGKIDVRNWNN